MVEHFNAVQPKLAQDVFAVRTRLRAVVFAGVSLVLAACSGIDLGDNPGPDVSKQVGPLTALPAHLRDKPAP